MKKVKRIILGEGYPWVWDCSVNITRDASWHSPGRKLKNINFRKKIRLVAEVIDDAS